MSLRKNRKPHTDGKVYFSYADIQESLLQLVPQIQEFDPDLILAIGGGGYIPARMLRTELKIPILAISLELYDDKTNAIGKEVKKIQWFDSNTELGNLKGKKVLIVDEVDDTRTTLSYCVQELAKSKPSGFAVAVIHNKLKEKKASLPSCVQYFAAEDVPDFWNVYPWESGARIREHEAIAARTLVHIPQVTTKPPQEKTASKA